MINIKKTYKQFFASLEEHTVENKEETEVSVEPTKDVSEGDSANLNPSENIEIDISLEDYTRVSGEDGAKVIDGYHFDEVSGTYKRYVISGFDASTNTAAEATDNKQQLNILLQNGLVSENGLNGVTVQDLLLVCQNIMEGYQSTKFACQENAEALQGINKALLSLSQRLSRRSEAGTLDTHTPES